jgi:hypothetical protein
MKKTLVPISTSILLFCAAIVPAQAPIPVPTPQPTPVRTINDTRDLSRSPEEINDRNVFLGIGSDDDDDRSFRPLSPIDLSKAARQKIKLSREEKALYKGLAEADDLKILKMFSAPQCAENRLVLDARDEKCAAAADLLRASFYSFLIGYYGETISDFRILEDTLIAGNGRYIHGFLVDLGETGIGRIGKTSAEVVFLRDFPAATTSAEETRQRSELEKGFSYQNLEISSRKKLRADHVYLMRIVSYSSKDDRASMFNKDSVYVFKVSGLSEDETAVILWKKLFQKNAPRLKNE